MSIFSQVYSHTHLLYFSLFLTGIIFLLPEEDFLVFILIQVCWEQILSTFACVEMPLSGLYRIFNLVQKSQFFSPHFEDELNFHFPSLVSVKHSVLLSF